MAQLPFYNRQYGFIAFQKSNPADPLPADKIEIEYNAIKAVLDAARANLKLIQRDDGALANESVGNDQLEVSLRTGINPPTVWSSSTTYAVNDTVVFSNASRSELWLALEAHTSGADFDTDAAAGKWRQLADWSTLNLDAAQTAYDNSSSGLTADDVQAAIDELENEIDAVSGSGVSDGDKGDITVSSSGTVWAIDSGVIDAGKLGTDAVETAKIQSAAVTTVKIASSAVVTSKLADSAVTTAKINDGAVATAKVADDAVTLAKMEHGTSGDILYYGASGVPTRLAKGTDGEALVLASGVPSWGSAGRITRGTAIATTSGGSHDFTGLPSGLDQITIMLRNVSLDNSDDFLIQIGDSGGFETTGYNSGAQDGSANNTNVSGFQIKMGGDAADEWHGSAQLSRIDGNEWVISGVLNDEHNQTVAFSGSKSLSAELDRVRLTAEGAGVFDSGKFNIQYQ